MDFFSKRREARTRDVMRRVTGHRARHEHLPAELTEKITGANVVIVRSSEAHMTAFQGDTATKIGHATLGRQVQVQPVSSDHISVSVQEEPSTNKGVSTPINIDPNQ